MVKVNLPIFHFWDFCRFQPYFNYDVVATNLEFPYTCTPPNIIPYMYIWRKHLLWLSRQVIIIIKNKANGECTCNFQRPCISKCFLRSIISEKEKCRIMRKGKTEMDNLNHGMVLTVEMVIRITLGLIHHHFDKFYILGKRLCKVSTKLFQKRMSKCNECPGMKDTITRYIVKVQKKKIQTNLFSLPEPKALKVSF